MKEKELGTEERLLNGNYRYLGNRNGGGYHSLKSTLCSPPQATTFVKVIIATVDKVYKIIVHKFLWITTNLKAKNNMQTILKNNKISNLFDTCNFGASPPTHVHTHKHQTNTT